jgi:uncharacterized protein (DUF433 family)
MSDQYLLDRITSDPAVFGGKPIICDTSITVEDVIGLLAQGVTTDEILEDYPALERADVRACLAFAQEVIKEWTAGRSE